MTDSCEHGYPAAGRGCHECDTGGRGLIGVWWALVAMVILASAFATAWWWVA